MYLSTLPPETEGIRANNPDGILAMNDVIREIAAGEGAVLVEMYDAFEPRKGLFIGDDGLHPTIAGYKVMADTWLSAIEATLEAPPPAGGLIAAPAGLRHTLRRP